MSVNAGNGNVAQSLLLVTSKKFPVNVPEELESILSKAWVDTAQAVNVRTIGIFNTNAITIGDKYYSTSITDASQLRQAYRQVFPFGAIAAASAITINFDMSQITQCVNISGCVVTDDNTSKFRAINWTSCTDVTEQIQVDFDSTSTPNTIIVTVGAAAPNVVSGFVNVEYLLN